MPKVGLNTFFNERFLPKVMYNHWYRHEYHSLKEPEYRSDAELMAYNQQVIKAVKKRGLIYQGIGHGWSGAFYGLPVAEIEDKDSFDKKAEMEIQYIAQINGKEKRAASAQGLLNYVMVIQK
jgi:hypothetical protein